MNELQKYANAFMEVFQVSEEEVPSLVYQEFPAWDSVGHMRLIEKLEDTFDIMFSTEHIIELSSYEKGKEILSREEYGIKF